MASEMRSDCESLAKEYANAKAAENLAKEARIKAEAALATALGGKDNGSSSFQCGSLKVTVKRGWNYKIDDVEAFAEKFPELVKIKPELDGTAYEKLRLSDSIEFEKVAAHITATPKKASVEVKL